MGIEKVTYLRYPIGSKAHRGFLPKSSRRCDSQPRPHGFPGRPSERRRIPPRLGLAAFVVPVFIPSRKPTL